MIERTLTSGGACLVGALLLFNVSAIAADEVPADGRWVIGESPKGGIIMPLPKVGKNITAAYVEGDAKRTPVVVEFNKDATKVSLEVPENDGGEIVLEVAEKTAQFPEGRIVLSALDAKVEGEKAKLETHPGNHRIGFWTEIGDSVHWDYRATRPGMYDVELCYSVAGGEGNEVEIAIGGEKLKAKLADTGSWYRYSSVAAGRVYIPKPGRVAIAVRGIKINGAALMNLKAVVMRPAPEGKKVVQRDDGSVELDAHDATVHGRLLQYERNPKKLCLGYWANANEWAEWTFPIGKPGRFRVELTQGCGSGHGGSEVAVAVAGKILDFTVEDTGGFQNWKVRHLGEVAFSKAGEHRLEVRPKNKKGVAVMDIRRVRLVPVE